MIEIKDNFLDKENLKKIQTLTITNFFPYYYNDNKVTKGDGDFQFTHILFKAYYNQSNYFPTFVPILEKLKCKSLIRMKLNLTTRTDIITKSKFHVDILDNLDCKTAIFYLNSNNGMTIFKTGKKIESIENRMIIFKSNLEHGGTSHTDKNIRLVLNINYY